MLKPRQGYNVRISGQDVGRATFAHRHAMLVDQEGCYILVQISYFHRDTYTYAYAYVFLNFLEKKNLRFPKYV